MLCIALNSLDCLNLGIRVIQDRLHLSDFKHVSQHCIIILDESNSFGKFRIASPISERQSLSRRDTSTSINRVGMRPGGDRTWVIRYSDSCVLVERGSHNGCHKI